MTRLHLDIQELRQQASRDTRSFRLVPREVCLDAVKEYLRQQRRSIRRHHEAGESGSGTLRRLSELCDEVVRTVTGFALAHAANPEPLMQRTAVCALGGYGRREMSPHSDLDISLLYDAPIDADLRSVNEFLIPFFWDLGFRAGYTLHSVVEAAELTDRDPMVYTSYLQARLIMGDADTFGRMKLVLSDSSQKGEIPAYLKRRERPEDLPPAHRDVFAPEPNLKESAGGLRDFHAGLWMILLTHGPLTLDDLARMECLSSVEHLEMIEGLDFLWRLRHELHFHTGRAEDQFTFRLQQHAARAFGYGDDAQAIARLMEDYYAAACRVRRFPQLAARICDRPQQVRSLENPLSGRARFSVYQQQLCVNPTDKRWFAENSSRLMEVIWECARRACPLSQATAYRVRSNLHLINDEFRSDETVRRYFKAVCSRPFQAGLALREAAKTGLLGAYLPEFAAIQGVVRYEDFHSYPVDEHTLRALEAPAVLLQAGTPLSDILCRVLERTGDAHVLVMSILFHDLGKAYGERHVEEGVRLACQIADRIGLDPYDIERMTLLMRYHMTMSDTAFYRDIDDMEIVENFARTIKTDDLLRMLLLLTYCDLSAVAPNVWNEWKGVLLLKLFVRAERMLSGRTEENAVPLPARPKVERTRAIAPDTLKPMIDDYLQAMGDRYVSGYAPGQMVVHMECLEEAKERGLAVRCVEQPDTHASEVVICTRDRHGLFSQIAGAFCSQLINVRNAALFTRDDGWVLDCFLVDQAASQRPLTRNEAAAFIEVLRKVVLEGHDIGHYVEKARRRLFALARPSAIFRPSVAFDNAASRTHTVIDIVAPDRTGLLYDIAFALSAMGIDFHAAHIVTDVGRARDAFYVSLNQQKLEEESVREKVRRRLLEAIAAPASQEKP